MKRADIKAIDTEDLPRKYAYYRGLAIQADLRFCIAVASLPVNEVREAKTKHIAKTRRNRGVAKAIMKEMLERAEND